MEIDEIKLREGSSIKNLTVPSGTSYPSSPNAGELFYRTDTLGLKVYNGSSWVATDITSLSAVQSINDGQLAGFRNRIINGGMWITQRDSTTITSTPTYGQVDRWLACIVGGTSISGSIIQYGGNLGFSSWASCNLSGVSFTNGRPFWETRLLSGTVRDLNSKSVTISGKLYHDTGSTQEFVVALVKPNTLDNHTGQTTIGSGSSSISVPSGVATPFSYTLTLGASDATNGLSVQVFGTTPITVSSKNFILGDMQLEIGTVATPYEHRSYSVELLLCQRFYQRFGGSGNNFGIQGYNTAGNNISCPIIYPVYMRATPTIVFPTMTNTNSSGCVANSPNQSGFLLVVVPTATGYASSLNSGGGWVTLSAEL